MAIDRTVLKDIQAKVGTKADGYWGPNTAKAVAAYLKCGDSVRDIQRKAGVEADGVVGPATLRAIAASLGTEHSPTPGTVFLDPGHTSDYAREHPSQFKNTDWTSGRPAEVLQILGITRNTDDSIEHVLNVRIAAAVQDHLTRKGHSVVVYDNPSLSNNAEIRQAYTRSNAIGPDAFVSIHNNAQGGSKWESLGGSASGTVGLYHAKSARNKILAKALADKVNAYRKATYGPNNRAGTLMESSVGVLSNAKASIPAALVEVGFYDNLDDLFWMVTHLDGIGKALAEAIHDTIS